MKPAANHQWLCSGILVLTMALCLAGCAPRYYPPPPPPPTRVPVPPPPQAVRPVFYIKASLLNLRACPGMDCPKISTLEKGEEVEKVGEAEDWFQIRVKRDGRLGWVDSRYLSSTPVTPAPESAPAPPGVTPPLPERLQPPPLPEPMQPPPLPEKPVPPAKPPAVEKPPKPVKPGEEVTPPGKKKPEEAKPARPPKPKPGEEAEPAPKPEKPDKKEPKPAPKEEKPAPPAEPESGKKIRIM